MFACQTVQIILKLIIKNSSTTSDEAKNMLNLITNIRNEKWGLTHHMILPTFFPCKLQHSLSYLTDIFIPPPPQKKPNQQAKQQQSSSPNINYMSDTRKLLQAKKHG